MPHITTRRAWTAAQREGSYRAKTLERDGFIHFSTPAQVVEVANFLYRAADLVLLRVLPEKLHADLRYEAFGSSEPYPHLYGPLNSDAVARTVDFPPCGDGTSQLPTDLNSSVTP